MRSIGIWFVREYLFVFYAEHNNKIERGLGTWRLIRDWSWLSTLRLSLTPVCHTHTHTHRYTHMHTHMHARAHTRKLSLSHSGSSVWHWRKGKIDLGHPLILAVFCAAVFGSVLFVPPTLHSVTIHMQRQRKQWQKRGEGLWNFPTPHLARFPQLWCAAMMWKKQNCRLWWGFVARLRQISIARDNCACLYCVECMFVLVCCSACCSALQGMLQWRSSRATIALPGWHFFRIDDLACLYDAVICCWDERWGEEWWCCVRGTNVCKICEHLCWCACKWAPTNRCANAKIDCMELNE